MKQILARPHIQVWVCVNERQAGGLPSCGTSRGNELYEILRTEFQIWAARKGCMVWVNRTLCQGFCHEKGVTVTLEPGGKKWQAVQLSDVKSLIEETEKALVKAP